MEHAYSDITLSYLRTYVYSGHMVALRGVMQALVRIQAYVLAGIVVAIPAVDSPLWQWCEGGSESVMVL
jgi:hypothetical protein